MIVMMIAITPSLNAANRSLSICALEACDDCRCDEIASDVQHCSKRVGNRVDGNQDANAFRWQTNHDEQWRQHDECATRNAGRSGCEKHRSECDRRELC